MTEKNIKISDLIPDSKNANQHTERGVGMVQKSLQKYGAGRSILIDKNNKIIAGNLTAEQAATIGIDDVVVVETTGDKLVAVKRTDLDLNDKAAKELAIADNRSSEVSLNWDAVVLEELKVEGVELDDFFNSNELEEIGIDKKEIVEDDVPEPPKEARTVKGDVYELGQHRVMCGNSTNSDDVAKLMNGKKADMVFTDPPYGNGNSGKYGRGQLGIRTIIGDNDAETFISCLQTINNLPVIFFLQWRTFFEVIKCLKEKEYKLKTIAVWDKKNAGLNGSGGIAEQWEAIIFAGEIIFSKFGGNVFSVSRNVSVRKDSTHPHIKPIELLVSLFGFLEDYKFIYDPFLGSGSTLIACEQTNRICYGMEIDEHYCDVIVSRYVKYTGNNKIKRNGEEMTWEIN